MKVAVIGANGKSGSLILAEAQKRGNDVTAIVRDKSKAATGVEVLEKDLFQLTYSDVESFDVIINAFAAWTPETLVQHETALEHLANILSGKENRLIVVGGAGSLFVDPDHTLQVMDTPDFPEMFKAVAEATGKGFDSLKQRSDVQWTYLSPPANFVADGKRTGSYTLGGEELLFNSKGESQISYADFAIAMVDEAEDAQHIQKRFTVVGEEITV